MSSPTFIPSYSTCDEVSTLCPVAATLYGDYFNRGGNFVFLITFALLIIWQIIVLIRYRTWSFSIFLALGTAAELAGYAGRVAMSYNPWNYEAFTTQLCLLILAPTLVAAAISVTFKHIVLHCGVDASIIRPSLYPWIFVGSDIVSLLIQGVGGGVSSAATSGSEDNTSLLDVGSGMLVAGVSFQATNMVVCGGLMVLYWIRWRKTRRASGVSSEKTTSDREDRNFRLYIWGMIIAYLAIMTRSIYRIPEMASGWGSDLMQDEVTFLVLDGAMVVTAVLLQSVLHPAYMFPAIKSNRAKQTRNGGVA